jgi:hypothetical protein
MPLRPVSNVQNVNATRGAVDGEEETDLQSRRRRR